MQAKQITVYSLEEFAREFLTKEQIVALGEVLDKRHTWGDTDLVCIGKDLLIEDLQRAEVEVPVYLVDHIPGGSLFEITGATGGFWEGEDYIWSDGDPDILADSC